MIGWIVGAVLLWISRAWTLRDKIVGTLVLPGGLLAAAWLVFAPVTVESCGGSGPGQSCSGAPTTTQQTINIAFFVVAVVLPVCTAMYLARRAQRPLGAR